MKKYMMLLLALGVLDVGLELYSCSFLRRYGVNSYITNIPLFFKKQDEFEPQRANTEPYTNAAMIEEIVHQEEIVVTPTGVATTDTVTTVEQAAPVTETIALK